jgi:hypothetical protein
MTVEDKAYAITFPDDIWKTTPPSVRATLTENLTYANTHFIPLLLDRDGIYYDMGIPLFESFLYRNQLYDLTYCEWVDSKPLLSYVKRFYNLDLDFSSYKSAMPLAEELRFKKMAKDSAVLPFSFGKESMLAFALCNELGINPILVYTDEPTQPYERLPKQQILNKLSKEFGVKTYYTGNEPGMFRYGEAFGLTDKSDVGWAAQTTILSLMAIPFAYRHQSRYILYGTEHANNDIEQNEDWKIYSSFDQTEFWTAQQSNMTRILTGGHTTVNCLLEPLEELHIFHMLHSKYTEYGKYQFSCFASKPLVEGSQWCHNCSKCARNFLYAVALGIDPEKVGFKKNLLEDPDGFIDYFDSLEYDYDNDMDYAMYLLSLRRNTSKAVQNFEKVKKPRLKPFAFFVEHFSTLKSHRSMPSDYESRVMKLFTLEMADFATATRV